MAVNGETKKMTKKGCFIRHSRALLSEVRRPARAAAIQPRLLGYGNSSKNDMEELTMHACVVLLPFPQMAISVHIDLLLQRTSKHLKSHLLN